ncbi:MAG: glutamate formimidoyltransferase, partial [Saprospiraceae bacterium]
MLLECVPNFSEGRDASILAALAGAIRSVEAVCLLHQDAGADANRTVFTFAGPAEATCEAAFRAMRVAAERIDMRRHTGTHPRLGGTDVCPLVPLGDTPLTAAADYARQLGERAGRELGIPVYLYEAAATRPEYRNLAAIRRGEYEGLAARLTDPGRQPDFGPAEFQPRLGATILGARPFLIAWNIDLNTEDIAVANYIAGRLRESGYREKSADGKSLRQSGKFKGLKAIGWH